MELIGWVIMESKKKVAGVSNREKKGAYSEGELSRTGYIEIYPDFETAKQWRYPNEHIVKCKLTVNDK